MKEHGKMDTSKHWFTSPGWFAALLLFASLAGCGGGSGGSSDGSSGSGTLGASVTDSPACGFDAVNVTVSKLRVHQSNTASDNAGGWSEINLKPERKINLLDLTNGVIESLGETGLPSGHYTQLRLVLVANKGSGTSNNSIVLSDAPGAEVPLATPSAVQSGIKLIHEFDVATGQRVDLVLDFDACKSVVKRGNGSYLLKPVIKVIPTVLNGISGFVDACPLGSNLMVSAQVNGTVIRSTVPNTSTGAFLLARLAPGSYDVVLTADNCATAVIGAVPVANSTSIVVVSTDTPPISLPPSTTHTISGNAALNPVSTTDEGIVVAARQTIGSGPTVTVQSQTVDPPGAYTLTLPIAAPLLGRYLMGGTPPIPLDPQPAGQYIVEASANGYQSQFSDPVDISLADKANMDFTLVPLTP
jgi:hypothetical protein